jgi:hypothetical protein
MTEVRTESRISAFARSSRGNLSWNQAVDLNAMFCLLRSEHSYDQKRFEAGERKLPYGENR